MRIVTVVELPKDTSPETASALLKEMDETGKVMVQEFFYPDEAPAGTTVVTTLEGEVGQAPASQAA